MPCPLLSSTSASSESNENGKFMQSLSPVLFCGAMPTRKLKDSVSLQFLARSLSELYVLLNVNCYLGNFVKKLSHQYSSFNSHGALCAYAVQ